MNGLIYVIFGSVTVCLLVYLFFDRFRLPNVFSPNISIHNAFSRNTINSVQDKTGKLPDHYRAWCYKKIDEFNKLNIPLSVIIVNQADLHAYADAASFKGYKAIEIIVGLQLVKKGRGYYTEPNVLVHVGKDLDQVVTKDMLQDFLSVTINKSGSEWPYGLQLFLQKLYCYIQNVESNAYTDIVFKVDPIIVTAVWMIGIGVLLLVLSSVFPRFL